MSAFEIVMLVCFGASWPISIAKALRTRQVAGKSPLFLVIVIAGYLSGIVHKALHSPDWVTLLYFLNLVMVSIDLALYVRFSKSARPAPALRTRTTGGSDTPQADPPDASHGRGGSVAHPGPGGEASDS